MLTDLADRDTNNPLLKPSQLQPHYPGLQVTCLLNPGVFEYNNKIWLLLRVAEMPRQKHGLTSVAVIDDDNQIKIISFQNDDPGLDRSDDRVYQFDGRSYLSTLSHLRLFCSDDGISFHEDPNYPPILPTDSREAYGIEDCRVSKIGQQYLLAYTQVSALGVAVGLMTTKDWKSFPRNITILPPHNEDCAIFEEKINTRYYCLHRPSSPEFGGHNIWLAESNDLVHWGKHRCLATTRPGMWDCARIGAGAAPVKTEQGWIESYHGADNQTRYCLGAL